MHLPYSCRVQSESIFEISLQEQHIISDLKNLSVLSQGFYYVHSPSFTSTSIWSNGFPTHFDMLPPSTTPRILLNWQVLLFTCEGDNIHCWIYYCMSWPMCCTNQPSYLSSRSSTWETAALYFLKRVLVMASGFLRLQPCTWATPCKQSHKDEGG